jgi:hypothetical protein
MVYLESAGPCESYDRTPVAAEKPFQRLCGYMRVDIRGIELEASLTRLRNFARCSRIGVAIQVGVQAYRCAIVGRKKIGTKSQW